MEDWFKTDSIPELFSHQNETKEFGLLTPRVFDTSDAGTGKTRSWLEVLVQRKKLLGGKVLVLAPKTILKNAWADDIIKFTPQLSYAIAYSTNRAKAFSAEVDVYITNHDAVKWLLKHKDQVLVGRGFHTIIIDESTAFKHRTSQRSKALAKLVDLFEYRANLTGTPNSNGLLDLWHQLFILDGGERLGDSYWRFRNSVCEPTQVGPSSQHLRWDDKDDMIEAVAGLIDDITIRHVFEECTDIPENHVYSVNFELSAKHRRAYEILKEHAILELNEDISIFNTGVLANKLLQMASGAVYDDQGVSQLYDTARYELVLDLAEQRDQCVIAFNWTHQRNHLVNIATKRKLSFAVIDGQTPQKRREDIVTQFQAGLIKIIFAHPATAAHGLTLTRGTTTIWASPVYNAEFYIQFNKRIYRIGQTKKTETLLITAENTIDIKVAERLMHKIDRMTNLLEMLQ